METNRQHWDFFIAHAGPDVAQVEALYDLLSGSAKVFLDSRSLELGDDWDRELSKAQRQSSITVVLVSSKTDEAYYAREEIRAAIELARTHPDRYRVVPLALDAESDGKQTPYGLGLKQGLSLPKEGSLEKIALRLLDTLNRSKYRTVLFDPREGGVAGSFRGRASAFFKGRGPEARAISPVGQGTLRIGPAGVLTITRTTGDGRFEIYPKGAASSANKITFPEKAGRTQDRSIWIHCEARSAFGKQGLRFILKNDPQETWLANEKRVIDSPNWTAIDVHFRIDPSLDFFVRIDHEEISQVPSELQLRAFVIREKDGD